jgi:inorganic phosphate transporter, PiT family
MIPPAIRAGSQFQARMHRCELLRISCCNLMAIDRSSGYHLDTHPPTESSSGLIESSQSESDQFMHVWQSMQFGTVNFFALPWIVLLLAGLALVFDFTNGIHDAANSIATVVSTRVLSPSVAVVWAAFFNFVAFAVFHLKVANTIGTGLIEPSIVDNSVVAATLISAIGWNLFTWYLGLPTSSSHALAFSFVGAGFAKGGWAVLEWNGIGKIAAFVVLSPIVGGILGALIAFIVIWLFHRASPRRVDRVFRRGQLLSAAFYSLGHGGNDAQKTMGIIFVLLIAASQGGKAFPTPSQVPIEVVLACHLAMGLGTLLGGWRIVKTMGQRIIHLRPMDGFCAETGAAITLVMVIFGGIPVSTTHTITGAIIGVGSMKRLTAVRWGVVATVVWAWVLTIPTTAVLAGTICWLLHHTTG